MKKWLKMLKNQKTSKEIKMTTKKVKSNKFPMVYRGIVFKTKKDLEVYMRCVQRRALHFQ